MVPVLALAYTGLYPLARGTLKAIPDLSGLKRFIPADAGNTTGQCTGLDGHTVYPR